MNERIRELTEQADAYALKTIGDKWIGWEEIAPGWVECRDGKFAELIVRECLDEIQYDDGATHVDELLPKHFGFEL
jgi:hypothetical protein